MSTVIQTPESVRRALHERYLNFAGRVQIYTDSSKKLFARWNDAYGIDLGVCAGESAISVADRIQVAIRTGRGVMEE